MSQYTLTGFIRGDNSFNYGGGSGGGSALAFEQLTPSEYEDLSYEEKHNGTVYFVSTNSEGLKGVTIIQISASDYENLSYAEKHNGIPYFVSDDEEELEEED